MSTFPSSVPADLRESHAPYLAFDKSEIEQSVCSRFEEQVRRYADRPALKTRRAAFSYKELNQAANRIAHAITQTYGTGPQNIAILVSDYADAVPAILGVLKAGKAFVILDRDHPLGRNMRLVRDADAELIVTDKANSEIARRLCEKNDPLVIETIPVSISDENPGLAIAPDAPACIVYTSGSTGEPKGVLQSQGSLVAWGLLFGDGLIFLPDDRVCIAAAPTSSHFLINTLRTLLNGGAAYPFHLRNEGTIRLAGWLRDEQITILASTASVFRSLVQTLPSNAQFPCLRLIRIGGELVSVQDFELFKKHFSQTCRFANGVGATETGAFREFHTTHNTIIRGAVMPTGYPVWGKDVLLLDEDGREVETGEVGEIAIRSRYLAIGYWRRPELTQAAFSTDPAGSGARIYRTGDLGRLDNDGCLYCLGRKDRQVKIRGNRVELAEVEASLRRLDGVNNAAVTARKNGRGETMLVGYIVPASIPGLPASALRAALRKLLPEYMVPPVFVTLDSIPMSSHGKVDYESLPAPKTDRVYVEPSTSAEEFLCEVWQEILGLERVGIRDDFVEIGGDSLSAARLMTEIESQLGRRVPISALLECRTVEELARTLLLEPGHGFSPVEQVQAGDDSKSPLFFLHGQYDGWGLYCRTLAPRLGEDQPFYALHPFPPDDDLPLTVEAMAKRYVPFIRDVQPHGPYLLGGHCNGGLTALEIARQLRAQGEDVALVVLVETAALEPAFRFALRIIHLIARAMKVSQRTELRYCFDSYLRFNTFDRLSLWQKLRFILRMLAQLPHVAWSMARRIRRSLAGAPQSPVPKDALPAEWTNERLHRHYGELIRSYRPRFYRGRLTVFRAIDEKRRSDDLALGWGNLATTVDAYATPGDHNSCLLVPQNARTLAEPLRRCLHAAASPAWPTVAQRMGNSSDQEQLQAASDLSIPTR